MFDASFFDINNTLFDECRSKIDEHNKLSYKSVSLSSKTVSYTFIDNGYPTDAIAKEIAVFYELFATQKIQCIRLLNIIESLNYTYEDLQLHMERSDDALVKLLTSLSDTRVQLSDLHMRIYENINRQTNNFIEYIKSQDTDDLKPMIKTIFVCMTQDGIDSYMDIDVDMRVFIPIGTKIIKTMYDRINNDGLSGFVYRLSNKLKQKVLNMKLSSYETVFDMNRLQTFGIVPDDGPNCDLKYIAKKLLG